jgi:hypothetical protein
MLIKVGERVAGTNGPECMGPEVEPGNSCRAGHRVTGNRTLQPLKEHEKSGQEKFHFRDL